MGAWKWGMGSTASSTSFQPDLLFSASSGDLCGAFSSLVPGSEAQVESLLLASSDKCLVSVLSTLLSVPIRPSASHFPLLFSYSLFWAEQR